MSNRVNQVRHRTQYQWVTKEHKVTECILCKVLVNKGFYLKGACESELLDAGVHNQKLGDCERGSMCVFRVLESVTAIFVGRSAFWEVESKKGCDMRVPSPPNGSLWEPYLFQVYSQKKDQGSLGDQRGILDRDLDLEYLVWVPSIVPLDQSMRYSSRPFLLCEFKMAFDVVGGGVLQGYGWQMGSLRT